MGQQTGIQTGTKQERYRRKLGARARYSSQDETNKLLIAPSRLTSKQIKFIELVGAGIDHGKAGEQSGITSSTSRYRCLTNPLAIQYLSALRSESRAIAAYDIAMAMHEAKEARDFALTNKNPMAVVKATELRAKLSGLLIDRIEIATVDLTGALDRAERRLPASAQVVQATVQTEPVNRVNP